MSGEEETILQDDRNGGGGICPEAVTSTSSAGDSALGLDVVETHHIRRVMVVSGYLRGRRWRRFRRWMVKEMPRSDPSMFRRLRDFRLKAHLLLVALSLASGHPLQQSGRLKTVSALYGTRCGTRCCRRRCLCLHVGCDEIRRASRARCGPPRPWLIVVMLNLSE